MINEEILTEKLKYIIISESKKEFEIMNVALEMDFMNNDKSTIESYRVFVKFDYNGSKSILILKLRGSMKSNEKFMTKTLENIAKHFTA